MKNRESAARSRARKQENIASFNVVFLFLSLSFFFLILFCFFSSFFGVGLRV
uniref:BZIP domain-containing protein n=1 Tax=Cajanus cajan TaxID=3821 RepID=A0A151RAY5_CAJCA|nr:hypothetical protein KK1_038890 [Cajanus cajan]